MDIEEFLRKVLPSSGFYVSVTIGSEGRVHQGFHKSISELATTCQKLDRVGRNTYYAVSTFSEKGSRKVANVNSTKALFMDVDVGKPESGYATRREALEALATFIDRMKLPRPTVVSSGKGFHVYWVLTRDLSYEDWKPLAQALKSAHKQFGFAADEAVTADGARILRPVGTHHPSGAEVKVLLEGERVTPEKISKALSAFMEVIPEAPKPRETGLLDSLAVRQEYPPAVAATVANKCGQIRWGLEHPNNVSEPFWYAMLGVAAYCHDPENTAVAWSQGYDGYSEEETLKKLDHWTASTTGPATCARFEAERPAGCKGCIFKGKIGTPARLGIQYQAAPTAVTLPTQAASLKLPFPFKKVVKPGQSETSIVIDLDGAHVDVCPFDVYPMNYGRDEALGYEVVRFQWMRPHAGWQELVLRQAYLTDGHREFGAAIADQGIVLNTKRQTEFFQQMLRSYMDELRQMRGMTNLHDSMGWKENHSQFVMGNVLFKRDPAGAVSEEAITLASSSAKYGDEMWEARGDLNAWVQLTSLLEHAKMPWHIFALGVGFSAPLYTFGGLKGVVVSLYGPTGGGKSLIQLWQQSIYGNPERLHFTAKFTQNALYNRLGMYRHLPMTIDETTVLGAQELGDLCYSVSQGREKIRLTRAADERSAKEWETPVTVSTNRSLQSSLAAANLESDAQIARLLELTIPQHKLFKKDSTAGRKIYELLTTNYGHAGKIYIRRLMEIGPDGLRAMITEALNTMRTKYGVMFSGEERYWEQAIALQDLGSQIAKDCGLIQYDYSKGTEWVLSQLKDSRQNILDNRLDAFDVLAEYLNEAAASAVTLMYTDGNNEPQMDLQRVPKADIRVRFEVFRKNTVSPFDRGVVYIDRTHFRRWAASNGMDYRGIRDEFKAEGIDVTPRSEKYYLGKNTPTKIGQTYVMAFNLNHPRLIGVLNNVEEAATEATLGKPRAVS